MRIQFGDWQLRKLDAKNWELYHRHVTKETSLSIKSGNAGKVRWHGTGRYYQASTFSYAIEYAADWELRNDGSDKVVDMGEYIKAYGETLERFRIDFAQAQKLL